MIRGFVLLVYVIAFFLLIVLFSLIPSETWQLLGNDWIILLLAFGFLVAVCQVLLAYSVYEDGELIRRLREHTGLTEKKLEELRTKELEELTHEVSEENESV